MLSCEGGRLRKSHRATEHVLKHTSHVRCSIHLTLLFLYFNSFIADAFFLCFLLPAVLFTLVRIFFHASFFLRNRERRWEEPD